MVLIRPFKALMFDWEEVEGTPAQVTSPPYDVLPSDEVVRLKKLSMHNVTHVTLPDAVPGKDEATKYQSAAKTLKRWRKEGVIHQCTKPGLYAYDETYTLDGTRRTVHGFVALLQLDHEYAHVRPHERTHKGPITDRLELLRETGTDLEPIQFLYKDPEGFVNEAIRTATEDWQAEPLVSFEDEAGTEHRLWAIEDPAAIEAITSWFDPQDVYIADGHHRYATALHYAKERRKDDESDAGEAAAYDFKMSVFVNRDDPGLSVFPTHRLIHGLADVAAARETLRSRFGTEPLQVAGDAAARGAALREATQAAPGTHRFVFYWGDGEADVLTLGTDAVPQDAMGDHSAAWRGLDVAVLHHAVLPSALGVTPENAGEHLRYTRIDEEAIAWVDEGDHQLSIFMNATPLAAVTEIADAGEHMPQKSTYFQPTLRSGLLFSGLR